jgi:CspA family cold shock protein
MWYIVAKQNRPRVKKFCEPRFAEIINPHTMQGTIKRLTDRGFGFIAPEDGSADLFFHSTELVGVAFDELREGDKVTFEVAQSDKGPKAVGVSRA